MNSERERRHVDLSGCLWLGPCAALAIAIAIPNCAHEPTQLSRGEAADGTRFGLSLELRRGFFKDIAQNDSRWRAIAERTFPDDVWAQADHWTDHMSQHVRAMATSYEVSIVPILLAYDEGIHEGWRGPGNRQLRATWPSLSKHK